MGNKADGTASAVGFGSSRACKCRWAPYVRGHGPGQGQLPVSTIKAPGHRFPDARGSTHPLESLGVPHPYRKFVEAFCSGIERDNRAFLRFGLPAERGANVRNRAVKPSLDLLVCTGERARLFLEVGDTGQQRLAFVREGSDFGCVAGMTPLRFLLRLQRMFQPVDCRSKPFCRGRERVHPAPSRRRFGPYGEGKGTATDLLPLTPAPRAR